MFEGSRREYPTAITIGPTDKERGLLDGVSWVLAQTKQLGGQPYVFAPTMSNLRDNKVLAAFAKIPGVASGTWKLGGQWSGGVVLAAWPTREKLGQIADDDRTRALVVVPWAGGATDSWAAAVNPDRLGPAPVRSAHGASDSAESDARTSRLDPVVVEGLRHLTVVVNHANNLAGSMDKRDAIGVLRMLHKAGYALPPDLVYGWALAHGWPARGAERLRELAGKFEAGIAVRGGQNPAVRPGALADWKGQASRRTRPSQGPTVIEDSVDVPIDDDRLASVGAPSPSRPCLCAASPGS